MSSSSGTCEDDEELSSSLVWKWYFSLSFPSNKRNYSKTLAGCSGLGVGIKFSPIDKSDISA